MNATAAAMFLTAVLAFGQTDRAFHFAHTGKAQDMKEIGMAIRVISDAPVAVYPDRQTLTIHGSAEQIALAEWMFTELDAPHTQSAAVRQTRIGSDAESTVRIFYLHNTPTVQDFQEVVTAIRTIADVRRVFTYSSPRAMIARTTPEQMGLAAWLVEQLDRPAEQKGVSAEYRLPLNFDQYGEVATRVLYTKNTETIQEFQQVATTIRTIADIRRVFTYNLRRAMIVRGTAEQIPLAQWLAEQLDQPVNVAKAETRISSTYQYDTPVDRDNTIRVFFVPQFSTTQDFQNFAKNVRSTTNLRRVFTYNEPRAIAVRGTIDQVATAERMVKQLDPK
jgi:hypothetical protein